MKALTHFLRDGNLNQTLNGHSLGTIGVSNLVSRGYLDAGLAHLDSLPFGNVAPAGVEIHQSSKDLVNGFILGFLFHPYAWQDRPRLSWFQHCVCHYHP